MKNTDSLLLPLVQQSLTENQPIDINTIKEICKSGALSEKPLVDRALAWMILLDVYPRTASEWPDIKNKIRDLYSLLIEEYNMKEWINVILPKYTKKESYKVAEAKIMHVIHQDINRSVRHIYFLPPEDVPKDADPDIIQSSFTFHMRRLERILYVFALTNPYLSYMQGFNEIITPLYYVLAEAKEFFDNDMFEIESLTFVMFQNIMTNTDLQEIFSTKQQSEAILAKMDAFQRILQTTLPDIYLMLQRLKIKPIVYAYRWFNNLFSQEHDLPNLLILWDSLFCHIDKLVEYCFYVGVAHIQEVSSQFDPNSFPTTISVLQNLKISNPITVLRNAEQFWNNRNKTTKRK